MEQTVVYVMFAGADARYVFPTPKDEFLRNWNDSIIGCGYYTGDDVKGNTIIINPSHCGTIEIGVNDGRL